MSTSSELLEADARPVGARAVVRHEITWMDTDSTGYWHNTTAMRLVEQAETHLHRSLRPEAPFPGLARVHVDITFRDRLALHDLVETDLAVVHVGTTSIRYAFTIRRLDDTLCAAGRLAAVQLDHGTGRPVPWSAAYRESLLGLD